MGKKQILTYICPFCDREVRVGESCKGCARKTKTAPASSKRPQPHDEIYDGLDLPDDDFDYAEFVAREFGGLPHKKTGVKRHWWVLAVAILALMLLCLVFRGHVFGFLFLPFDLQTLSPRGSSGIVLPMRTYTQLFEGATIEVTCDENHCTARRIEPGESVPRWSYLLSVTRGRGSNDSDAPVFDLAEGTVDLHVCALGGTGHEPWEEAWATLSLKNGAVLYFRDAGG